MAPKKRSSYTPGAVGIRSAVYSPGEPKIGRNASSTDLPVGTWVTSTLSVSWTPSTATVGPLS